MKPIIEAVSPLGRVQRVRREIRLREVEVARIEALGSGFVRIAFSGDSLGDFASDSFDDHVKFIFSNAAGESIRRDYTPRSFDRSRGEIVLEFALHGDGEAANWAQSARIGQRAVIGGPRGSMIIPLDYDWHLLAGDATALPAIDRRLEELPAQARAMVMVQVSDPRDQRAFASRASLDVQWLSTPEALVAALGRLQLPVGDGFVWFAGETSITAEVRRIMIDEKRVARESTKIAAYWKRGTSDFHEPRGA
jgi:NADPH-dependent ferric siderophore reductase